jgi:hypothetical protein
VVTDASVAASITVIMAQKASRWTPVGIVFHVS